MGKARLLLGGILVIMVLGGGYVWVRNPFLFFLGRNVRCDQNEVFSNRWGEVACGDVISADNNDNILYFGRLAQVARVRGNIFILVNMGEDKEWFWLGVIDNEIDRNLPIYLYNNDDQSEKLIDISLDKKGVMSLKREVGSYLTLTSMFKSDIRNRIKEQVKDFNGIPSDFSKHGNYMLTCFWDNYSDFYIKVFVPCKRPVYNLTIYDDEI